MPIRIPVIRSSPVGDRGLSSQPIIQFKECDRDEPRYSAWKLSISRSKTKKRKKDYAI